MLSNIRPTPLVVAYDKAEKYNYQYIVVEVDEAIIQLKRDQLIEILHAENIIARRYFYPGCHRMEPYRSYFPHARLVLPETERLVQRVIILPTGNSVNEKDIIKICHILKFVTENASQINRKLLKK